jgi:hypothetical protein
MRIVLAFGGSSGARAERLALVITAVLVTSAAAAQPIIVQGSTTFNRRVMERTRRRSAVSGQRLTIIPNKTTPGWLRCSKGARR